MSHQSTVSINIDQLPTRHIALRYKGRGSNKNHLWTTEACDYSNGTIELSETQIHLYMTQALKEFHQAQLALKYAQDRVDSLRMFARELYAVPKLKAVAGGE